MANESDVSDSIDWNIGADTNVVLAIDPGSAKCGVALVRYDLAVVHRAIVPTAELLDNIQTLITQYYPFRLLIGNGTNSKALRERLESLLSVPVEAVHESHTSEEARARWVQENPARGLEKLLPRSLRTPTEPYDDWVAVILAERFWLMEHKRHNALNGGKYLLRSAEAPNPDLDLPRSAPPPASIPKSR